MNARPSRKENRWPERCLGNALFHSSNCHYSRFCFFHGMRVHTGDIGQSWRNFEVQNFQMLNALASVDKVFRSADGRFTKYVKLFFMYTIVEGDFVKACRHANRVIRRSAQKKINRLRHYAKKFFRYAFVEKQYSKAMGSGNEHAQLHLPQWNIVAARGNSNDAQLCCLACRPEARRCFRSPTPLHIEPRHQPVPHGNLRYDREWPAHAMGEQAFVDIAI